VLLVLLPLLLLLSWLLLWCRLLLPTLLLLLLLLPVLLMLCRRRLRRLPWRIGRLVLLHNMLIDESVELVQSHLVLRVDIAVHYMPVPMRARHGRRASQHHGRGACVGVRLATVAV
jgi:hypothetical protein